MSEMFRAMTNNRLLCAAEENSSFPSVFTFLRVLFNDADSC
jgi:hypothetical protein